MTGTVYITPPHTSAIPVITIRGRSIAAHRGPIADRIDQARAVKEGRLNLVGLSNHQLAALFRVPVSALNGHNGNAGERHSDPVEQLLKKFRSLTPEQQVAFVRAVGSDYLLELAVAAEKSAHDQPDLFSFQSENVR